jgi:hypothetical protein
VRLYLIALAGLLLVGAASGGYLFQRSRELDRFCRRLPLGLSMAQVREAARDRGFESRMEPYGQMRIEPAFWPVSPPSCRVIFNAEKTVGYRLPESG